MKPKTFSVCLKVIIIFTAIIGLLCLFAVIPKVAEIFQNSFPEFAYWVLPWKIVFTITSLPCFTALVLSWLIGDNIGKDNSFSLINARLFKIFSILALADSIFFSLASIVLWLCGMNHPGMLIVDILIAFIGLAIYVCTSAMSFFVKKAATLQEDSDLTI